MCGSPLLQVIRVSDVEECSLSPISIIETDPFHLKG
jgi:hypothetical protein